MIYRGAKELLMFVMLSVELKMKSTFGVNKVI